MFNSAISQGDHDGRYLAETIYYIKFSNFKSGSQHAQVKHALRTDVKRRITKYIEEIAAHYKNIAPTEKLSLYTAVV